MSWIQKITRKDGVTTYWVRDVRTTIANARGRGKKRGQRQVSIFAGSKLSEAQMCQMQYDIRRDIEKEGYFDCYDTDQQIEKTKRSDDRKCLACGAETRLGRRFCSVSCEQLWAKENELLQRSARDENRSEKI